MDSEWFKILIVEDESSDAKVIGNLLAAARCGCFEVEVVQRLAAAEQRISQGGVDGVLLDLMLPDSSGLDTFRDLHRQAPSVPIVVLSSLEDEQLALAAVQQGAQDYLVKGEVDACMLERSLRYAVERQRTSERQRRSEAELRLLVEQLPALMWTTDRHLRMTSIRGAGLSDLGQPPQEIVGKTLFEVFETGDAEHLAVVMHRRAALGESMTSDIKWQDRTYHAHVEPLNDARGRSVGCIGVAMDITARILVEDALRQSEEEVRRLNTELEERVAQRTRELSAVNRELEAYSYSVSHDLRSPLRAIDGFTLTLLEDYGGQLDDRARSYLLRVRHGTQRMGRLIDAMLALSRITCGDLDRELIDLSEIAESVATDLRRVEPDRRTDFVIQHNVKAEGDPQLLRALLENLLGNAWKFTACQPAARIEFGAIPDHGCTTFFVRDDGVGFEQDYADKLFESFQRLHRPGEYEGVGIGLATVQRIVQRHGGRVWAEGKHELGATFYFTI